MPVDAGDLAWGLVHARQLFNFSPAAGALHLALDKWAVMVPKVESRLGCVGKRMQGLRLCPGRTHKGAGWGGGLRWPPQGRKRDSDCCLDLLAEFQDIHHPCIALLPLAGPTKTSWVDAYQVSCLERDIYT